MYLKTELKKLRRTGYLPAFVAGALLACAFTVVNMAARSENYTSLSGNPFDILADASWQMMAMINILLTVCGACIMYHTEYADHGAQKMDVLPVRQEKLFLGKFVIAAAISALVLLPEILTLAGCALHWFPDYRAGFAELAGNFGFEVIALLPTVMLMLVISSACRNMWISLGIGVILVFTLSIFPQTSLFFRLCPFSTPYQLLKTVQAGDHLALFTGICIAETVFLAAVEFIYLKIRRYFS